MIEWITSTGIIGLCIIAVVFLISVILLIKNKAIIKTGSVDIALGHEKSKRILLEHDIFINLAKIIWGDLRLSVESANKREVIESFYKYMCRTMYDTLQNFVKDFEDKKKQPVEVLGILTSIIAEYNIKAKDLEINLQCGTVLRGVPERLLEVFDRWNEPHIAIIQEKCLDIIKSDFHLEPRAKLVSILDAIDVGCRITLLDLMSSANVMNGQLEEAIAKACENKKE